MMGYENAHIRWEQWFLPEQQFKLVSATAQYDRLFAIYLPWWNTSGEYQYYRDVFVSSVPEDRQISGEISAAQVEQFLMYEDGLGYHAGVAFSPTVGGIIGVTPEIYPDYPTGSTYDRYGRFDYIDNDSITTWGSNHKLTMNIPIYDMTKHSSWDNLNNYIATGDDSGADNYDDLHPIKLHTTIWFDGKYPSIYHKTEVVEGEYGGNINLKVVANVSSQSPTETYNGDNHVDAMQYMTFADYGNIENVTEFEFLFCRSDKKDGSVQDIVAWTCTLDFAFDKNTGDYIAPSTHPSGNGNHTISFEEGVPSDEDYEDENDEWKHDQTHNSFSGANTLTKTYKLSNTQIRALGNFLWSSTFKDNILSLTQFPLDNVVSLKAMPITVGGNEEEIKIGNVNTGINGNVVSLADGIETTVGECVVSRVFNNFIDFTDFEMFIYLPFIGFKSIDPSLCMNRRLRVKYYFDVILGNCLATLEMADMNGKFILYNVWQANCGIDIAITATNRAQIENGYIGSALNAVGSILSKNPLSLLGDVFKATTQEFHSESNGVGNPSLMNKLDTTCYIFVKRPQKYKPTNYGHYFGIPNYKFVDSLSSCHGFTKTHGFICSLIDNALDGEKKEIEDLLNSGVIFN